MKIVKEFILREIAGECVLVPTGATTQEFNGLITLNEVGAFLWGKLQQDVELEQLVDAVLDEYDIDKETATHDAEEFVENLKKAGIIK